MIEHSILNFKAINGQEFYIWEGLGDGGLSVDSVDGIISIGFYPCTDGNDEDMGFSISTDAFCNSPTHEESISHYVNFGRWVSLTVDFETAKLICKTVLDHVISVNGSLGGRHSSEIETYDYKKESPKYMQCKCGGVVSDSTHEIKTSKGLSGWTDVKFIKDKSPYTVRYGRCRGCGRNGAIDIIDNAGIKLEKVVQYD